jgi:P-type Cu2+ transporter
MTRLQPLAPGELLSVQVLWAHARGLAEHSSHPVSQAIAADARAQPLPPTGFAGVQEEPGIGVDGRGRSWSLGARPGLAAQGPAGTPYRAWLVCDGVALAGFDLTESVRTDAAATVAALQKAGMRVSVLSGDEAGRTDALARLVGADRSLAGASPDGKLLHIQQAQAAGAVVLMVGDGVNDSPVLAGADVSMAMAHGARGSREQADFLLNTPRLGVVAETLVVARRTRGVARQNLLWAAAYNLLSIPLAVAGWLPPWAAGLGMASSSLLVMLNAARLSR